MEFIRGIFWNAEERRLRTFWRFLLMIVIIIMIAQPINLIFRFLLATLTYDSAMALVLDSLRGLLTGIAGIWLAGRFVDRRRFADFGFHLSRRWWQDLGFGLGMGALLMAAIFVTELALGWVFITNTFYTPEPGQSFWLAIWLPILLFIAVAINEELLFRGYFLKNVAEGLNLPRLNIDPRTALILALIMSSLLFGLAHVGNPNATTISTINIVLAGVWLGAGYLLTGELAIPIGLHITWNFFQGHVFGFPVSGTEAPVASFMTIEQAGPALWTGGSFGPEAGLLANMAFIVGILLIFGWVRLRSGHVALQTRLAYLAQPQSQPAIGMVDGELAVVEEAEMRD